MSWAKRVRHPSEMLKKGDEIEVVVLDISQEKKRISLGMKQLQDNPWEALADEFSVDTATEGRITRILDRGAVVELRSDVEGFVPVGQMGKPDLKHPEECFTVGDVLPLRVIKVDPKNKRIVLSVGAYLKGVSTEELNAFHERFPVRERQVEASVGDSEIEGDEPPEAEEVPGDAPEMQEVLDDAPLAPSEKTQPPDAPYESSTDEPSTDDSSGEPEDDDTGEKRMQP